MAKTPETQNGATTSTALEETTTSAATVPAPEPEPDPTAVEVRSKKPGYYPGLGLMVEKKAFYSPNDAARILKQAFATNDPDFADVSADDLARLRKQGLLPPKK